MKNKNNLKNNHQPKRVLSLIVGRDDGAVVPYFGIEYENKLWLITAWVVNQSTGVGTPERMIRVDSLDRPPQKCDPGYKYDYIIQLLPKDVIEGVSEEIPGFEVRSLPEKPTVHRDELFQLPNLFG